MKPIEEIKKEVIAECIFRQQGISSFMIDDICAVMMSTDGDGFQITFKLKWFGFAFHLCDNSPNDHGFYIAYRLLGLEAREKDAEIERLKAIAAVWEPVSAMAAVTESLKLANQESEIERLRAALSKAVAQEQSRIDRDRNAVDMHNNTDGVGIYFDYWSYTKPADWFIEAQNALKGGNDGKA